MRRIAAFLEFEGPFITINENVNKAKEILYSEYASKKGKSLSDLTPAEKMGVEEDPRFLKVKEVIGSKNPRLIYPFTKFFILDGAPWEDLVQLAEKYLQLNPGPKSLRLGPIENYAELPANSDPRPYIQLDQDLDTFSKEKEARSGEPRLIQEKKPKQLRPEIKMLIEYYAKAKKINPSEVTPEEIQKMESSKKYLRLKEKFLNKYPGLMPLYTKFYIVDNESWDKIEELSNKLEKVKPQPGELPVGEGNLSDYLALKKEDQATSVIETLLDDLGRVEKNRLPKKLLDLFPRDMGPDSLKRNPKGLRRMRWVYDQLIKSDDPKDKARIDDLIYIATQLESLEPKEQLIKNKRGETGPQKTVLRSAWDTFLASSAKYNDYYPKEQNAFRATYPNFVDPYVAFDQMIQDGFDLIEGWNSGLDDLKQRIKDLEPRSAILYDSEKYLVTSARTNQAVAEVCKIVSGDHCIKSSHSFWNYTGGGKVQLSISDFNRKQSDLMSLFTMTINKDGTLSTAAGRDNNENAFREYQGKLFDEVLRDLGYPEPLVATCASYFPLEQKIKEALEIFFKIEEGSALQKNKTRGITNILKSIQVVHDQLISGKMTESQWNEICGVASEIIFEGLGISTEDLVKYFCGEGIYYESDYVIFKKLLGDYVYSDKEAKQIKEASLYNIETAEETIEDKAYMEKIEKSGQGQVFYNLVKNKQKIIDLLNSL